MLRMLVQSRGSLQTGTKQYEFAVQRSNPHWLWMAPKSPNLIFTTKKVFPKSSKIMNSGSENPLDPSTLREPRPVALVGLQLHQAQAALLGALTESGRTDQKGTRLEKGNTPKTTSKLRLQQKVGKKQATHRRSLNHLRVRKNRSEKTAGYPPEVCEPNVATSRE